MRLMQYPSSKFYKEIINRPVPTIVYFFNPEDGCGPGEEFEILESGEHLSYEHETFFVNVSESPVPNTPSDLPVTILFSQGEQLGTANGGDIPQFFELIEEAESQVWNYEAAALPWMMYLSDWLGVVTGPSARRAQDCPGWE